MPPIEKSLFDGGQLLEDEDVRRLEVANTGEAVDEALRRFDWGGHAAGCTVLQLTPDNSAVASGQFAVRGRLTKEEWRLEAAKIWNTAEPGLTLTIQIPAGSGFTFSGGGMASDYLDMEQVEHCVTTSGRGGQLILQSNYKERGVGTFCIRMVCHIQRASSRSGVTLGFTILLFPGTSEEVMNISELAKSPSWPGLKVIEGEMPLFPTPSVPWKCPTLPLLQTGTPWAGSISMPTVEELREKVAWIMATSEPGEACKTRKTLLSRWEKFANHPDEFCPKRSPLTWPKPTQTRIQGREMSVQCA